MTTLKGESYVNGKDKLTLGDAIANILSYDKTGGKYKMYKLAEKFASGDEIDIDDADYALIKKSIEDTECYRDNFLCGSLIDVLINAKDAEKEEKKNK